MSTHRLVATPHVLLVDDDTDILRMSEMALRRAHMQVTTCASPEDALRTIHDVTRLFDVIVTDLNMPRISGLELSAALLAAHSSLVIVLTSADLGDLTEHDVRAAGCAAFLAKPYRGSELVEVVRRVRRP
jgi:DNA-binding response OmpR family regulator